MDNIGVPSSNAYLLAKIGVDTTENEPCKFCPLSVYRSPSRISSSHFHLFFFVPSLCIVCRDVNRCALLVFRPSWKHFRAVCFPFETQSGLFHSEQILLLLLLLQIPQVSGLQQRVAIFAYTKSRIDYDASVDLRDALAARLGDDDSPQAARALGQN